MPLPPICIPSYRRANTLRSKTLSWLEREGYPAELIHIYVSDAAEAAVYTSVCPDRQIHIGVPGYTAQLRHIQAQWPLDQQICICHDDITDIKICQGGPAGLTSLLQVLSARMADGRIGLAGVLPNDDGRNLSDRFTTHLTHIVGCFYLMLNRRWDMRHLEVEDYERSIRYFQADGKVLRYKGAGVSTRYNSGAGGLSAADRMDRKAVDAKALAAEFPDACDFITKAGGKPDIRLSWRYKPCHSIGNGDVNYII